MVSGISKTLMASAVFLGVANQGALAMDEKQQCPGITDQSMATAWAQSEGRESLRDNEAGQSPERIERGETYVAFMDFFWTRMDEFKQNEPAGTVGGLLKHIEESYRYAHEHAGEDVSMVGATTSLVIDGNYKLVGISLSPSDESSLVNNEVLENYLQLADNGGITIDVKFALGANQYIQSDISYKGMFKGQSISFDSPIEAAKIVTGRPFMPPAANVTDGYACP